MLCNAQDHFVPYRTVLCVQPLRAGESSPNMLLACQCFYELIDMCVDAQGGRRWHVGRNRAISSAVRMEDTLGIWTIPRFIINYSNVCAVSRASDTHSLGVCHIWAALAKGHVAVSRNLPGCTPISSPATVPSSVREKIFFASVPASSLHSVHPKGAQKNAPASAYSIRRRGFPCSCAS